LHYELDDFTRPWRRSEAIVIQHGMGRNSQFWRDWPPALGTDWRIIRADLPGHGDSEPPPADHSWRLDELVKNFIAFLDELRLERVHFVGESTAGMLGIALAAQHPERLHSLTLCASPTTIDSAAQAVFAGGYTDWQTAIRTLGSAGWARLLANQPGTMGYMSNPHREWVIEQFGRIPSHVLVGYSVMVSETDVSPLLSRISIPTLILAPTASVATPLSQQRALAAQICGSRLEIIEGAGHEIYANEAHACCREVRNFLLSLA
jgi:pimeloyl-ACP methyl ester carboxylesterase